jgi:hypothetical protein
MVDAWCKKRMAKEERQPVRRQAIPTLTAHPRDRGSNIGKNWAAAG